MLKKVTCLLSLICMLAVLGACGKVDNIAANNINESEEIYALSLDSKSFYGSGVLINVDDRIYVLSAKHVCEEDVTFTIDDEKFEIPSDEIIKSSSYDLAIFEVPENAKNALIKKGISGYSIVKEDYDNLQYGENVKLVGKIDKEDLSLDGKLDNTYVYCETLDASMMLVDAAIRDGMSGGAILSVNSNLLGIIYGISEDNMTAAVPLPLIMEFLDEVL